MTDSRSKILVVDDDDRLRDILEARLSALGHEVITARDGEEALASAHRENPDLILMDVMMPRLDGYEAARRLKNGPLTEHIPIVMVTALNEVNDRVRALEAGADDFLTKPVDASELKARVKSLLQVKAYHDYRRRYQQELESEVSRKTQELRDALARLQSASLDTIYRLARAAEFKDHTTYAHLQRVSQYAAATARAAGQPPEWIELLLYAAPMHDIGKIGIADHILCKPEKLTADEWAAMEKHAEIGAEILSGADSELLKLAEVIARAHHEKWGGGGYPKGLRGEEIPLAARIVAIADVYDALCSPRSYKEAMTEEQVLKIIREGRGRHFDPALVDAFLSVLDQILIIRSKFSDENDRTGVSPPLE
jgi:putative two-component system response regulator